MKRAEIEILEACFARLNGSLDIEMDIYISDVPDNPYNMANYYIVMDNVGSASFNAKGCPGQEIEITFDVWGKTRSTETIGSVVSNISQLITVSTSKTPSLITTTNHNVVNQLDRGSIIEQWAPGIKHGNLRIAFVTQEK